MSLVDEVTVTEATDVGGSAGPTWVNATVAPGPKPAPDTVIVVSSPAASLPGVVPDTFS